MSELINHIILSSTTNDGKIKTNQNKTKMTNISENKINEIIVKIESLAYNQCYVKSEKDRTPGEPIIKRETPPENPVVVNRITIDLLYNLTLSLLIKVYGDNEHVTNFQSQLDGYIYNEKNLRHSDILTVCLGKIEFLKAELELGLLKSIRQEVTGEIVSDFLFLARQAIGENNKEVASVLACASLEDILKKYATTFKLEIEDKTMNQVINSLKSKGVISSTQSNILKSYAQIRNKVFHAEWSKFEKSDINSIIGFTEQFLIEHF